MPTVTAAAVAAVLLLSPLTTAWSSLGSYEPDTIYDSPDFMWADAGPASGDRVYFNGITATQSAVNPNVGALQTTNEAPTMERPIAVLGVWIDCNEDGFMGHAESALLEYDATLLLDDTLCPPSFGDVDVWTVGAHNYNGLVTELIPIGLPTTNDPEDGPSDARVYVDADAKVWAEFGRPTDLPRGTCALNPFPRGMMHSTAGILNYLDCRYEVIDVLNAAIFATGDPLGLAFPDPEDADGAPLDFDTFGEDSTDHASAAIFDCNADPFVDGGTTFNESDAGKAFLEAEATVEDAWGDNLVNPWALYDRDVRTLDPRTLDPEEATVPGQMNQTQEEVLENCDTSDDNGNDFYGTLNEGNDVGNGGDMGKRKVSWGFGYFEGTRGVRVATNEGTVGDTTIPEIVLREDGATGPFLSLGTGQGHAVFGTSWNGDVNFVKPGPSSVAVRQDPENPGVEIAPGYYLTFYAFVGPAITATLDTPGGTGIYGAEHCGEAEEGIINGWNCDRSAWNLNPDGSPLPGYEGRPFVHDPYNLRDIDCYDGSTSVVAIGLPAYGENPCERPS